MKCSNFGFESQEGASWCRRYEERLAAAVDPQVLEAEENEAFTDFSREPDFFDAAPQVEVTFFPPQTNPPSIQPQVVLDRYAEHLPPTRKLPSYEVPVSPPLKKRAKQPDPHAEYLDKYIFPPTPLISEIWFDRSGSVNPSIFFTGIIVTFLALFFYMVFPIPTSTGYFHDLFTEQGGCGFMRRPVFSGWRLAGNK